MFKKYLIIILFPMILLSGTLFDTLNKEDNYSKINNYVIKENRVYNYIKNYIIETFDNQPNRIKIDNYFNLDISTWNNYNNDLCPTTIDGTTYNNMGCLNFIITPDNITLLQSLHNEDKNIPDDIKIIYNNNSYELLNSYVYDNINRIYINDKVFYHLIKLRNKIYDNNFQNYISEDSSTVSISDKIWLKPNKLNGLDLYLYNDIEQKWEYKGTIAYSITAPYEITIDIDNVFNPDVFPGIINMKANVYKDNKLSTYYYNGEKWIAEVVNSTNVSSFSGYSNILPLTTTLLTKIGDSDAIITDDVFFSDNPTSKKVDVEQYDTNGDKIDLLGFWITDRKLEIFSDNFTNNINYINTYNNTVNYMFYPKKDKSDYIPMKKIDNKWIYISKTNGYDGVLEYPYNITNNSEGPDIGNNITYTEHKILSWDTKDIKNSIRAENLKQYFRYDNDKVFYSISDYSTGNINNNIQLSEKRSSFFNLSNSILYLTKYSECDYNINLGDNICHDNGKFAGDMFDNLYQWYYVNNELFDAHKVNSYSDMYIKNNSNNYYPLIIFNNQLYDLVLDNNNNPCYKKRSDNKYYTSNGKIIPYYINGIGILPVNKTCENIIINNYGNIEFDDLIDLIDNYNQAPDNSFGYVISKNKNYNKQNDYWYNITDKIYVTKFSREKLPNNLNNDIYLTKIIGSELDIDDINKNYRYNDNGINYQDGNNNENNSLYKWNLTTTDIKALNNLIDILPDGTPCDDNNPNTVDDVYNNGICQGNSYTLNHCYGATIGSTVNGQLVVNHDMLYFMIKDKKDVTNVCTSNITNMSYITREDKTFNQDISNWDTSHVTNMSKMFYANVYFNQDISNWDTSNVTDMSYMFDCHDSIYIYNKQGMFNQPIGKWNVSNVTNMESMFYFQNNFNQSLNNWNTSKVTNMHGIFEQTHNFNQPLNNWNVSNVIDMSSMFMNSTNFNQDISNWDISNVTNMENMFAFTYNFNQLLDNWNTIHVTNMSGMFSGAIYNQPLNNWDTSKVTNMKFMFSETIFNQNISNWNTGNVTDMSYMFYQNKIFNQNISCWNVNNVIEYNNFVEENINNDINNNLSIINRPGFGGINNCHQTNPDDGLGNILYSNKIDQDFLYDNANYHYTAGVPFDKMYIDPNNYMYVIGINPRTIGGESVIGRFNVENVKSNSEYFNNQIITDINIKFSKLTGKIYIGHDMCFSTNGNQMDASNAHRYARLNNEVYYYNNMVVSKWTNYLRGTYDTTNTYYSRYDNYTYSYDKAYSYWDRSHSHQLYNSPDDFLTKGILLSNLQPNSQYIYNINYDDNKNETIIIKRKKDNNQIVWSKNLKEKIFINLLERTDNKIVIIYKTDITSSYYAMIIL